MNSFPCPSEDNVGGNLKASSWRQGLQGNTRIPCLPELLPFTDALSCIEMGKPWKQWLTLFFWTAKSLQMVIAAMKLKGAYSLEGKL